MLWAGRMIQRRSHFKNDSSESSCEACSRSFTVYRRRHHCRACGTSACLPSATTTHLSCLPHLAGACH